MKKVLVEVKVNVDSQRLAESLVQQWIDEGWIDHRIGQLKVIKKPEPAENAV